MPNRDKNREQEGEISTKSTTSGRLGNDSISHKGRISEQSTQENFPSSEYRQSVDASSSVQQAIVELQDNVYKLRRAIPKQEFEDFIQSPATEVDVVYETIDAIPPTNVPPTPTTTGAVPYVFVCDDRIASGSGGTMNHSNLNRMRVWSWSNKTNIIVNFLQFEVATTAAGHTGFCIFDDSFNILITTGAVSGATLGRKRIPVTSTELLPESYYLGCTRSDTGISVRAFGYDNSVRLMLDEGGTIRAADGDAVTSGGVPIAPGNLTAFTLLVIPQVLLETVP